MKKASLIIGLFILSSSVMLAGKMNLILVMSDDQGYGDLSCNGNPYINTPNIDKLSEGAYNFRNYHVGTTCAPTRASLMSGMHFNKVGCWHTIAGRSLLDSRVKSIADVFKANGYSTAMFGKWHLGDNYPYRPFDRGFETTLWFKSGGITQISDQWGNNYIDDVFLDGETPVPTKGYCTDVFFDATIDFIEKNKAKNKPFFCYLALNVSHGPGYVEDKYSKKYKDIKGAANASFCGMVENMDINMGRLRNYLDENNLSENTIVIFTTDNGTGGGYAPSKKAGVADKGYNAGMKGKKTSNYDGGHRVAFIMKIPNRKGGDVKQLTSVMDVAPSLYEICGIKEDVSSLDGISFASILDDPTKPFDRYLVIDTQRSALMQKDKCYVVLRNNLRYVDGKELYDVTNDVGQKNNIIADYPEVAKEMQAVYDEYWKYISPENDRMNPLYLASPKEDYVLLSAHDRHEGGLVSQASLRKGNTPNAKGFWYVKVPEDGIYSFEIYRWPLESGVNLKDSAPAIDKIEGFNAPAEAKGVAISDISGGEIIIGDISKTVMLDNNENPACIRVENLTLKQGEYKLYANLLRSKNAKKFGATFLKIIKNK